MENLINKYKLIYLVNNLSQLIFQFDGLASQQMLQLQQMRMLGQYSQLGLNNFNGHFGQSYPNHGQSVQETHQQSHINEHDYGENHQHSKMVSHDN